MSFREAHRPVTGRNPCGGFAAITWPLAGRFFVIVMVSASGTTPASPGVVNGRDIDAPGWGNDGDKEGLQIGHDDGPTGDAQRPE